MRPIPFLRPTLQLRHRHHLDSTTGQWIGILATDSCLLVLMTDCGSLAVRPGFFVDVSNLFPLFFCRYVSAGFKGYTLLCTVPFEQ